MSLCGLEQPDEQHAVDLRVAGTQGRACCTHTVNLKFKCSALSHFQISDSRIVSLVKTVPLFTPSSLETHFLPFNKEKSIENNAFYRQSNTDSSSLLNAILIDSQG